LAISLYSLFRGYVCSKKWISFVFVTLLTSRQETSESVPGKNFHPQNTQNWWQFLFCMHPTCSPSVPRNIATHVLIVIQSINILFKSVITPVKFGIFFAQWIHPTESSILVWRCVIWDASLSLSYTWEISW
jgi:hypothetical protein